MYIDDEQFSLIIKSRENDININLSYGGKPAHL